MVYFYGSKVSQAIPSEDWLVPIFIRSGNYNWTNGALNNRTGAGNFWSSYASSVTNSRNLNFNSTNLNPQNNNNKGNGRAVRCVAR